VRAMQFANTIIVKSINHEIAKIFKSAIDPDNEPLPPHIRIKTRLRGSTYQIMIETQDNLSSLLTTTDELLQCLLLIQNILERSELKQET